MTGITHKLHCISYVEYKESTELVSYEDLQPNPSQLKSMEIFPLISMNFGSSFLIVNLGGKLASVSTTMYSLF